MIAFAVLLWKALFRAAARLTFLCAAKEKVSKRKAAPGGTPALRAGPQAGREFFEGTSLSLRKTAHVLCAAPAGFYPP